MLGIRWKYKVEHCRTDNCWPRLMIIWSISRVAQHSASPAPWGTYNWVLNILLSVLCRRWIGFNLITFKMKRRPTYRLLSDGDKGNPFMERLTIKAPCVSVLSYISYHICDRQVPLPRPSTSTIRNGLRSDSVAPAWERSSIYLFRTNGRQRQSSRYPVDL